MHRRRFVGVTLATTISALVLLASACTGGDAASPPLRSSITPATESVAGGTLRIGTVDFDASGQLDPLAVAPMNQSAMIALDLLFDSLMEWPGGVGSTEPAQPSVAAATTPDASFTVWTVALDPARTFSDGSPLRAEDVRFSLERMKAAAESNVAGARLDVVASVEVVDPATVRITTTRPFVELPELLASPLYGIVSQVEADGAAGGEPVGSGPYGYVSRQGSALQLARVAGPAGEQAGPDRVELQEYDSIAESFAAFQAGQLDWSMAPVGTAGSVGADASVGRLVVERFGAAGWLGVNGADPTYSDPRFRQAIAQAIDRDAVVAALGRDVALGSLVVDGVPGFVGEPCGEVCRNEYDPAGARALVASVFPGGAPVVVLDGYDDPVQRRLLDAVQADLEAVGIPVEQHVVDAEAYERFVVGGDQGVFSLGTVGIVPIQDSYVGSAFLSSSSDNVTGLRSGALDEQIAEARGTADVGERQARYRGVQEQVLARYVQIPLYQLQAHQVISDRVVGFTPRLDGTFVLGKLTLTSA